MAPFLGQAQGDLVGWWKKGEEDSYIYHFQVIGIVRGGMSVLHILPDDLGLLRISVNHLENRHVE